MIIFVRIIFFNMHVYDLDIHFVRLVFIVSVENENALTEEKEAVAST